MNVTDLSLLGRVAVITGGSRGIGKAIALTFASAGADVVVCSRGKPGELEQVLEEILSRGRRALAVRADVSQKTDVTNLVKRTIEQIGDIDILVNNAGIIYRKLLLDTAEHEWDETMNIDLKGCYLCSKAVGKTMIARGKGTIINLSSRAGLRALSDTGAYCVAKAGVVMMTQVLALELAHYNIRVNAIAPGLIKTDMTRPLWDVPEVFNKLRQIIPMGRIADTDEIARVALFLASDASSYITGQTIIVDGGRNL